ncbi:MAG: hypothetical protein K8R44_04330, partial [Sulfurimonas sp.]|nr:hypothetical protein [Sulfurimonas sp.]
MIRFLTFLTILITMGFSQEYPLVFKKLSTPLYDSVEPIAKLCNIDSINKCSLDYIKDVQKLKNFGYKVDKTQDKQEIKEYLFRLRKLQKKHDYILNEIHKNINKAIDKGDYKSFFSL